MSTSFKICIAISLLKICMLSSYAQVRKEKIDNSFKDTNSYGILSIAQFKVRAFDSTYTASLLTEKEIKIVENLFFKAISDYNEKTSKDFDLRFKDPKLRAEMRNDFLISLTEKFYAKQLFPVLNKKGEKEVFINCFTADPKENFWKYEFFDINDGGNNNFRVMINITQGVFYYVVIGGYG